MLRRLVGNVRSQNWGQALLELFVVAIGILMAFQVDRWWEDRKDRQTEQEYVNRLIEDLEQDVEDLNAAIELAETRRSFARLLIDVAENPEVALRSPVEFILAVDQAAATYTPALTSNTFDELRATGNLRLLRDTELKESLFEYYRHDESQRQYQDLYLQIELRHFEFAAGVLTNRQALRAYDEFGMVSANDLESLADAGVDLDEVRAAALRLQANTALVNWLPHTYANQLDLIGTNDERRQRAEALLQVLRENQ